MQSLADMPGEAKETLSVQKLEEVAKLCRVTVGFTPRRRTDRRTRVQSNPWAPQTLAPASVPSLRSIS